MSHQQPLRPAIPRWPVLFLGLAIAIAGCSRAREPADREPQSNEAPLEADCRQMADWLVRRLGPPAVTTIRAPLVLAGDLPESETVRWYEATLRPAMQAMAAEYFPSPQRSPVSVVLCATSESYQRWSRALRLSNVEDLSDRGYYDPNLRLIVVNVSHSSAALLHELTHALMDSDFPGAPLWLREGLAGLHEACDVSRDPPRLVGKPGPRGATLAEALRSGRLIPLEELCRGQSFAAAVRAERYAQARYFCLYLQQRGRLAGVYRELQRKPADRGSLPGLLGGASWPELEADFRRFLEEVLPKP